MKYKNILVAVDMTDEAEDVLSVAREIVVDRSVTVSVVTVIRPLADFYINLYTTLQDSTEGGIDVRAAERANEWLSDLLKGLDIDASAVKVVIGTPAVEIRQLAGEIRADLIVLGTHGRHGLGMMLGSTANAVLHGAPCDVLAVKVRTDGSVRHD